MPSFCCNSTSRTRSSYYTLQLYRSSSLLEIAEIEHNNGDIEAPIINKEIIKHIVDIYSKSLLAYEEQASYRNGRVLVIRKL